jgi:trimethylamine--corrinoid protein Co-methyltransferase
MHSKTPDIIPFPSNIEYELLTQDQLEMIQAGTLQLLGEVGVHFPSQKALQIFSDHGAQIDWEKEIVRIQPDLVKKAMSTAPRTIVLGGREERLDMTLDGSCSYIATDGTGVHVIDIETGEKRASRKEDIAMMARVCDALPLISFFWPPVSAQDYGYTAPLHQCHAGLTNTLKHVRGAMTVPEELARLTVEMATVVAGSQEVRRKRSPICANICTIAPLAHDGDGIESALVYAETGIPTSFMAMPTMGSTAPATPLGALVVGDAEVVSAMVLMQLAQPGAPVFHSIVTSLMHPRTGGYIGEVSAPVSMMSVELAHAWGVPSLGGGSTSTDSPHIDWQAGCDAGWGANQIPLIRGEVCGYLCLTQGSMILIPEKVILEHDVCLSAFEHYHGFEFEVEDLALDLIREIGPGSHYLAHRHTRQHIRDFRFSPVFYQYDSASNLIDPRAAAQDEFKRILRDHQPEPLPKDALAELDQILVIAEGVAENIYRDQK